MLDTSCLKIEDSKTPDRWGARINGTLWGETASRTDLKVGLVIAVKRARTGFYNDAVTLNIGEDCDIEINPSD